MANYVVKIQFENVVKRRTHSQYEIVLAINPENESDSMANISIRVGLYDKIATKLFTLPKTIKIDHVVVVSNEAGKGIEMLEIKYLSHSKKRLVQHRFFFLHWNLIL